MCVPVIKKSVSLRILNVSFTESDSPPRTPTRLVQFADEPIFVEPSSESDTLSSLSPIKEPRPSTIG